MFLHDSRYWNRTSWSEEKQIKSLLFYFPGQLFRNRSISSMLSYCWFLMSGCVLQWFLLILITRTLLAWKFCILLVYSVCCTLCSDLTVKSTHWKTCLSSFHRTIRPIFNHGGGFISIVLNRWSANLKIVSPNPPYLTPKTARFAKSVESGPEVHWPVTTCRGSSPAADRIVCVNKWPVPWLVKLNDNYL
jgi:hypothetical protein